MSSTRIRLLYRLWRAWRRHPSQRFCQFVVNTANRNDPFYVEDDEFMARLTWK